MPFSNKRGILFYLYPMEGMFPKKEKLKSTKLIEEIFEEGNSIKKFPIRLIFLEKDQVDHHQAAFAVPKKNFKSAIQRNRIKRQLREAYRLQKGLLPKDNGKKFVMVFLFISKEKQPYHILYDAIGSLLKSL